MVDKDLKWLGRPILQKEDLADLERQAAVNEFVKKQPRKYAEEEAYRTYVKKHHVIGAAHHLGALKAVSAAGQAEEAKKHSAMYGLHLHALGKNPNGPIPEDVKARYEKDLKDNHGPMQYRGHISDNLLFDGSKKILSDIK